MACPAGHDVIPDLTGDLFERNYGDGARNGIVFFLCKVDDALVGAAAEVELGIAKGFDERAVDQCIYIWKDPAHTLIGKDFFVCKAGIAPDIFRGLLLYATGKFSKRLDLIQGIATRKGDIGEFICLDNLKKVIY